ncbi:MAG TPA: hypothetical protein VK169_04090 [Saprospiraceae bacterium]|nr:hypothetical protein [Saprospiraceae bacterium]
MKINYFTVSFFTFLIMVNACETPKVTQKPIEEKPEFVVSDDLIVNMLDSVNASELRYDETGSGTFGRKIIYRDLSAAKSATYVSGRVGIKLCINREGIVKYAEILQDSSTIKDVRTLKNYLKASCGYKFQPNPDAPDYECGRMRFKIENTINKFNRN